MGHCIKCDYVLDTNEILYQLRSGHITNQFGLVCYDCMLKFLALYRDNRHLDEPLHVTDVLRQFWGEGKFDST